MTTPTTASFLLLVLVQLLSLSLRTDGAELIVRVCAKTREPALCASELRSDPRSASATHPQLTQITIDMAEYKGGKTKIEIHGYLLQAKDPRVRDQWVRCENSYIDALALFDAATGHFQAGQRAELHRDGVGIRGKVDGCEAALKNDSPVKAKNRVVGVLADAIASLAQIS